MDATAFIDRQFHFGLRHLGRYPWMEIEGFERRGEWTAIGIKLNDRLLDRAISETPFGADREALRYLIQCIRTDSRLVESTEAVSKLLADGPKVFRPSLQQCEAMEQVALELIAKEYQQAFPCVVVEFPTEFAALRQIHPQVLVRHDAEQGRIFALGGSLSSNTRCATINTQTICNSSDTIESSLSREIDWAPHLPRTILDENFSLAVRIALNCNLALTHYATRLRTANETTVRRLRRRKNNDSDGTRRHEARRRLIGEFSVIEFEQQVEFHDSGHANIADDCASSAESRRPDMSPHWRKGHWRRQVYGIGRKERRLVFIKPILVRRDKFAGSLADTSVVYSTSGETTAATT